MPLETEVLLQDNYKRNSDLSHLEDLALKSAIDYFGDELIHWLGIQEKAVRSAPTEIVELETRHMYEDFLYEMENGNWYHFEFESDSLTVDDMKRFREYEASTARRINAPVITYVICSSKVKKIRSSISEGINTYRVRVIRLKDNDPGKILSQLEQKTSTGLQREDIIPLLLSPLMAEKPEQKNRIMDGIHILKKAESSFSRREVQKMEAILYAFAVKFLNNEDLTVVKEAIAMTKLGQMIWDDAVKEGERIGRKEGERIGAAQDPEANLWLNPQSWAVISDYAFYRVSSLEQITLAEGIKSIGNYAFYYCTGLTAIELPATLESIGEYAFYYCDYISSIKIPASVTTVGSRAFAYWNSYRDQTIYVPFAEDSLPAGWNENWAAGCDSIVYAQPSTEA